MDPMAIYYIFVICMNFIALHEIYTTLYKMKTKVNDIALLIIEGKVEHEESLSPFSRDIDMML